jgi:16S rRNA pseudouridine516 synthase
MRRLDQLLSSLGYCSRREAEKVVKEGRVCIAGVPATRADQRANPREVTLDGKPLEAPEGLLALLHKPTGYVCTHADGEGPTIYELLPAQWLSRNPPVTSVGRLDKDTSGVLLITDIGPLVQRYTSPRAEVDKVYEVTVDRDLDPRLIETFASGTVMLRGENKPCLPAKLEITGTRTASLTISEGRYHQVRRMFASQGWHVEALHRSRFGEHQLGDLAAGEWRLIEV